MFLSKRDTFMLHLSKSSVDALLKNKMICPHRDIINMTFARLKLRVEERCKQVCSPCCQIPLAKHRQPLQQLNYIFIYIQVQFCSVGKLLQHPSYGISAYLQFRWFFCFFQNMHNAWRVDLTKPCSGRNYTESILSEVLISFPTPTTFKLINQPVN